MSYSAHRPGRFGSDGRIVLDEAEQEETEPLYLSDVRAATATADPLEQTLEPWGAPPIDEQRPEPADEAPTDVLSAPAPHPEPEPAPQPEPEAPAVASTPSVLTPRRPRLPWTRRLAVLGGADAEVLAEVPIETSRFVQMFFVLAGTALVSALSMFFALITGVGVLVWVAIPVALVWALIIFNLDRFLTSTMKASTSILKLIALALPRVVMAAIIGIVVAEPLVLQVFHNDIAREVTSTNITNAVSDQQAVSDGPEKKALDAASKRVNQLEDQAATGIVAGTSTTSAASAAAQKTVDDLSTKLDAQQKVIDQARALYQCELTGQGKGSVAGCTGVTGSGASADAAKKQLASAQDSYDALAAKLKDANATLAAADASSTAAADASAAQNKKQAQDELPAARTQYTQALKAYDDRAASVAGGNAGAEGLLSQISALDRLSQREPTLAWAHWLIAALFFMIELLPVLVKVLTSYGEPSLYEKAETMRRQVALDRTSRRTWDERAEIASGGAA
ncbi:DUF4407 domain-containing protein [Microbacterium horticulturae]|uniref:DUF4407 domain-containing protein n=1 Tax=Microbacterium horticulturae TaxID=3028316 RepID=A0ABY8BYW7_9MICO|nr:DUF4407 domain-containing protein [Microbacterium sp. KACC 23027]WEG08302.1 DUF4407 domain-containing protein [Microbacterium sp. KACC 23027]